MDSMLNSLKKFFSAEFIEKKTKNKNLTVLNSLKKKFTAEFIEKNLKIFSLLNSLQKKKKNLLYPSPE
jgi:hypothetical protein